MLYSHWAIFSRNGDTVFRNFVKDTVKALDDFRNKQEKCMKQCFLICKSMYILKVYQIHYTLRWNTNLKEIPMGQKKRYKKYPFFFCELQLITVLLLICNSYINWYTRFVSLKLRVGFSIFDSIFFFFFVKVYIFVQPNSWTLDFKTS